MLGLMRAICSAFWANVPCGKAYTHTVAHCIVPAAPALLILLKKREFLLVLEVLATGLRNVQKILISWRVSSGDLRVFIKH